MNTFLTNILFDISAKELDSLRLGKERVEVLQILKALTNPDYGWQHHPAVNMWRGYEPALIRYGWHICQEWKSRGFKDTCEAKILSFGSTFGEKPPWLIEEFASNHRAVLLGKVFEKELETRKAKHYHFRNSDYSVYKKYLMLNFKAKEQLEWYQQWNWSEKPAVRNEDNRWPYLWPEVAR